MRFYLLVLLLVAIATAAPHLNNIRHKASSPPFHQYQHHLGKRDVNEMADSSSSDSIEDKEEEYYSVDEDEAEDMEDSEDDVKPELEEAAEDDETANEEENTEDLHSARRAPSHRHGFKPFDETL